MSITTIPSDQYHADDIADQPSLSASIAHILCTSSPAHARAAHPRLNPAYRREDKHAYDVGTAAHAMLLEGRNAVLAIDADSWRTNAAKEARDQARAQGKIPLLIDTLAEVEEMVAAVSTQLVAHEAAPALFADGQPEQTIVWQEDGVTCRARLDWLHTDYAAIDDLKTTSRSANPEAYSRALFGVGGDVQAAMYVRGVEKVTGVTPEFRWVIVETAPPYALSVVSPGPDVLALGEAKVLYAIERWRECLRTGLWPSYPTRVCYATMPAYEETRWLERTLREEMAA